MGRDFESEPLMRLEKITKSFNGASTASIRILDHADFEIRPAETLAIVGPSGIGKSTLLNIIGALDRPDGGKVFFKTRELTSSPDKALASFRNARIGFVFQFHYLFRGFSALENVILPGLIAGKNKKTVEKLAVNMLERVGLTDRLNHRAEALSGGEQQRTALARALIMNPDLLLADEPTGNLDRENSRSIHELLEDLNKTRKMALIVVTHNQNLADRMSRKVTIKDGKIIPFDTKA